MSSEQVLAYVDGIQEEFLSTRSLSDRKKLGQYFSTSDISSYMAGLLSKPLQERVRVLDAGAGSGMLTVATAIRCLELGCNEVHAVLYELDELAVLPLKEALTSLSRHFSLERAKFTFEIRNEDFVLSRPDIYSCDEKFDIAVINPPYFKYNVKDSPYAKAVSDLYHGDPNIYASFVAVVLNCLKTDGQMVSITPRSFTNGLYFRGFRSFILSKACLAHLHIFRLRDQLFQSSRNKVLQENIICKFIRGRLQGDVVVTTSDCASTLDSGRIFSYSKELIIDETNDQMIIRVPESSDEARILQLAETLDGTFHDAGLFISTGPVVEHRAYQYIVEPGTRENTVPLFRPHNVTPNIATWTGEHKKDVSFELSTGHEKHSCKNGNYVLLKRLSSKDERRRLVAAVYESDTCDNEFICFGNKINYIGVQDGDLSKQEACGIASILNSTFMDRYFRCISGNTQVNATELRVMRFPNIHQVRQIGLATENLDRCDQEVLDEIVIRVLGIEKSDLGGYLGKKSAT